LKKPSLSIRHCTCVNTVSPRRVCFFSPPGTGFHFLTSIPCRKRGSAKSEQRLPDPLLPTTFRQVIFHPPQDHLDLLRTRPQLAILHLTAHANSFVQQEEIHSLYPPVCFLSFSLTHLFIKRRRRFLPTPSLLFAAQLCSALPSDSAFPVPHPLGIGPVRFPLFLFLHLSPTTLASCTIYSFCCICLAWDTSQDSLLGTPRLLSAFAAVDRPFSASACWAPVTSHLSPGTFFFFSLRLQTRPHNTPPSSPRHLPRNPVITNSPNRQLSAFAHSFLNH
jgi:hypothetical protein